MTAWAYRTEVDLDALNAHLDALEGAGLLGIAEQDGRATAYFPRRVDGLPVRGRWEAVPDTDWGDAWREHLRPVTVGPLTIAPPWLAESSETVVVIEPGQAFGTGQHETTAGCLAALCEHGCGDRRVLDAGCGSGVLAIAAARLGAAHVTAVDTDPEAVAAATANAQANRVTVDVRLQDAADVDGTFDVVVANLDTATLARLAPALAQRLAPGGLLIASGVSLERLGEAAGALDAAGFAVLDRPGREWAVLLGRRG